MGEYLPTHYFLVRLCRRHDEWDHIITMDSSWLDYGRAMARMGDVVKHFESEGRVFGGEQMITWRGNTFHWMRTADDGMSVEVVKYEFERVYEWETVVPGVTDVVVDTGGSDVTE